MRIKRFTLLELMIAIFMLAGLTAIIFMSASGVTASWERMTAEKQKFSNLMVLDRALDSLLSNAVPFRWEDDESETQQERPVFYGHPDQIGFATIGQAHSFETGGLMFVHLAVVDGNLTAFYQSRPLISPENPADAKKASILSEGVDRIECEYADVTTDGELEWVTEWDPEKEREEIPLAILIRVVWEDGNEDAWLRRTAGSGEFERYGKWKSADE